LARQAKGEKEGGEELGGFSAERKFVADKGTLR